MPSSALSTPSVELASGQHVRVSRPYARQHNRTGQVSVPGDTGDRSSPATVAPEVLGHQACWDDAARGKWEPRRLAMPLDVYPSEYPYQAADAISTSNFRRHSAGACGAAVPAPPGRCYSSTQRYEWVVKAGDPLSASQINQSSFCAAMARMNVRRLAVIGDSISWQMFVSLWRLLSPRSKPPRHHPHNMTIAFRCTRGPRAHAAQTAGAGRRPAVAEGGGGAAAVGGAGGGTAEGGQAEALQTTQPINESLAVQVSYLEVQNTHLDRGSALRIAAHVADSDLTVLNFGSQ